jgi:hypothetical protein
MGKYSVRDDLLLKSEGHFFFLLLLLNFDLMLNTRGSLYFIKLNYDSKTSYFNLLFYFSEDFCL